MRRLGAVLALLVLGVVAPSAAAVTPQRARAVAEQAIGAGPGAGPFDPSGMLISAKRKFRPVVEIHRLKRALRRGALVGQGVEPARKGRRVQRRAFLFWGDYAPGAAFAHPSRLVLIDAATGKVAFNRLIGWWPEVNDKRVFVRGRGRLTRPRVGPVRARGAVVPGFKNDCLVTIGDRTDPYFLKGMAAVSRMAQRHGMPSAPARRLRDLGPAIDRLAAGNPPCKDVMIYIAAHGYAPEGSKIPAAQSTKARVQIKAPAAGGQPEVTEDVGLDDIRKIMHDRPNLSFKLVVDSCFSGRWTLAMAEPNLRITLTSSRQDEVTWLAVTHAQAGKQVDGAIQYEEGAPVGTPDDPGDPPPFTKGLTQAVDDWAEDPANQNGDLGQALGYGGKHREGDRARALGWQHGKTDDRTDTRPVGPGGTVGPTPFTLNISPSYRHIGPGSSETCWGVQTNPARPSTVVTITVRGPNNYSESRTDSTDSSGFVRLRTPINQTGTYTAEVHANAPDGATASGNSSVEVKYPDPGGCPAP